MFQRISKGIAIASSAATVLGFGIAVYPGDRPQLPSYVTSVNCMAHKKGSIVPIYRVNKAYPDALRKLLDQPDIKDLPIYVLAVSGEYRTGKSFLLSYLVRYLCNQNSENWMGNENDPLIGFDHKLEVYPVTQGLNIWDQPLIVERQKQDGSVEKILVLLIDSQGLLCNKDEEEATRIFALTTMISSNLVFTVTKLLNENILNYIKLFTAYSKMASSQDANKIPFQNLMLLIQGWGNPSIKPFGSDGGDDYFQEYFHGKTHFLNDSFRHVECYLMPKPGRCVENPEYDGSHKELEQDFKHHLKFLTDHLFDRHQLMQNKKEVTGVTIKAGEFCKYYESCAELLDNVDWKQPHNVFKMHIQFNNESAKREAEKVYKEYMDKKIQETTSDMTNEQVENIHEEATVEAKNKYHDMCTFTRNNDPDLYTITQETIDASLKEELKHYKQREEDKRKYSKVKMVAAEIGTVIGEVAVPKILNIILSKVRIFVRFLRSFGSKMDP